jgi:hypothetical protein
MLFLTQTILRAAGFEYDDVAETWVVPVRLQSVVNVECDEDETYILEAMLEFQHVLEANHCTHHHFSIHGRGISITGLTETRRTAAATPRR